MLIHIVADYGHGDLAFAEVHQQLSGRFPEATFVEVAVAPFDTLGAGFCVAQLGLTPGPEERIVFHNVAPRADVRDPRHRNEGERLVAAELPTGALVVGPNAGNCYSFVRDEAVSLRYVQAPASGSQFRSRDFFPDAIASLVAGAGTGEPVPRENVPPIPEGVIAYVDGYGNLKTTWRAPPAGSGQRVLVRIGGMAATAIVSDGTFEIEEGELAFAPGSSGWTSRSGEPVRFFELFLRGSSAAARFGHPTVGSAVEVESP